MYIFLFIIFISDGAKSDTGNITELFAKDNVVLVPDPVYPVYVDTNTMDGKNIIYMNFDIIVALWGNSHI